MPKRLPSPPDVRRLQPEEAQLMCRFCLRAQRSHWMETLDIADGQNWADSELGQLYAQLTGDQLFDNTDNDFLIVSNSWCHDCALQLRQAAKVAAQFRRANAFWSDYLNAWSPTGSTAAAAAAETTPPPVTAAAAGASADQDLLAHMKVEVQMIKTESAEQSAGSPEKDALAPNDYDMEDHLESSNHDEPAADSDVEDFDRGGGAGSGSEDEEYKPIALAPKPRKRGRPKGSRTTKSPAQRKSATAATAPVIKRESPQQLTPVATTTTTATEIGCKAEGAAATAEEKKSVADAAPASKGQMCHICGGVYKWKMDRHMEAAHSELTCDICGRTFNHKVPLRRHFREDHGFQRYTCEICNRPGMTKSSWLRHQDMHRPKKERPYACDQCGNSYPTLHNLRQHVARVHVFKEVACEECGKTFVNVVRLRDHMIRHRPKTLTCPQPGCPRMFWLVKEQKEHCRTVHQKDRKYVCAVCGKAFLVNAQLKKHHSLGRCRGAAGAQPALGGSAGGGGEHRQRGGRGGQAAQSAQHLRVQAQAQAQEMVLQQQQQQQQTPQTLPPLSSVELQQQQQHQVQMQSQPILHMIHHPHGQQMHQPQQQQQQQQQQHQLQLLPVGPAAPVATLATAAATSSGGSGNSGGSSSSSSNSTTTPAIVPQMMIFGPAGAFNPINMFTR